MRFVMHQSILAAPTGQRTLRATYCGAFARVVSSGSRALAYPKATPGLLTHTCFLTPNTKMVEFIGKTQWFDNLSPIGLYVKD